jgi:hypothetical protein
VAQIDYGAVRDALNMPNLTDGAVQDILDKKGITTQAGAEQWAQANAAQAQPGFFEKGWQGLTQAKGTRGLEKLWDSLGGAKKVSKPSDPSAKSTETAAQKQAAAEQKQAAALKQQLTEVASSPWTTAANALSQSFQADLQAVQPDISGAAIPAAQTSAASGAAADLGLSSMSPGAAWLAQGASDAQAQTQGVAGAMNAEGQAYANAAGPISKAITQWGQDNAIQSMTAAQGVFANALASHVQSNISYYGGIAPAQVAEIKEMPAIVEAFQQSGGGTSGSGLTPLTSIKVSPTGQVNVPSGASNLSGGGVISPSLTAPPATNAGAG